MFVVEKNAKVLVSLEIQCHGASVHGAEDTVYQVTVPDTDNAAESRQHAFVFRYCDLQFHDDLLYSKPELFMNGTHARTGEANRTKPPCKVHAVR